YAEGDGFADVRLDGHASDPTPKQPSVEELDVLLDRLALPRGRLARGSAEMEEAEHPLATWNPECLAAFRTSQHGRRAPVRREPALGRGEQHEHDRGRHRADVFLVL